MFLISRYIHAIFVQIAVRGSIAIASEYSSDSLFSERIECTAAGCIS